MTHRPRMRARKRLLKSGGRFLLRVAANLKIDVRALLATPVKQYSSARQAMIAEFNKPWQDSFFQKLSPTGRIAVDPIYPIMTMGDALRTRDQLRERHPEIKAAWDYSATLAGFDFSDLEERVLALKQRVMAINEAELLAGRDPKPLSLISSHEEHTGMSLYDSRFYRE